MLKTWSMPSATRTLTSPASGHNPSFTMTLSTGLLTITNLASRAVYLVEFDTPADIAAGTTNLTTARAAGVNIISPALPMLLAPGGPNNKSIVPSNYAKAAKAAGFDIIAWTFERSGPLATVKARQEYYFNSIANITTYDGQYYEVLDVLVNQIGIIGLFSDWSATVTYFANCFGLKGPVGGSYK